MISKFTDLWKRILAKGDAHKYFEFLERLYSEGGRFYHNIIHIENSLNEFEKIKHLAENADAIEFAIWYHDAIYNPKAKDNEEKSAQLAYDVCEKVGLSLNFTKKVFKLIIATKHDIISDDFDENLMVDIDLSSFSKSKNEFDEDSEKIRKEYSWVSEKDFSKGRINIFQSFLDRPSIYLTDFFRERYESQARENLQRSVINLKA